MISDYENCYFLHNWYEQLHGAAHANRGKSARNIRFKDANQFKMLNIYGHFYFLIIITKLLLLKFL